MRSAVQHGYNMMAWQSLETKLLGGWGYNIFLITHISAMNCALADAFSKKGYGCCSCVFVDRMVFVW
jgi:serine protease inhibitor ecotin